MTTSVSIDASDKPFLNNCNWQGWKIRFQWLTYFCVKLQIAIWINDYAFTIKVAFFLCSIGIANFIWDIAIHYLSMTIAHKISCMFQCFNYHKCQLLYIHHLYWMNFVCNTANINFYRRWCKGHILFKSTHIFLIY